MTELNKSLSATAKEHTVLMEILCLGLCRTGTQSLANALPVLGYGPIYHMRKVYKNGHGSNWMAALNAKFAHTGTAFGREEFDEMLGDFSGLSDIPAALFIEELMDAYPEAKIILTTREEEKWMASMKRTMWSRYPTDQQFSPVAAFMRDYIWTSDPVPSGLAKFKAHNELVMQAANTRGREVLIFQVKEGWPRLCEFLGKEVPEGKEFPNNDDMRM